MPWVVTLEISDCQTGDKLKAMINDGNSFFVTDANGQFIAIIDDQFKDYIISISSADHVMKLFDINRENHEGTIQKICLDKVDEPPPETGTTNGDGW